jgi:hypothetical protein
MENERFDAVVRCAATSTGRRRLLQAAAAVGVGGLLTRAGMGEVMAACISRRSRCTTNKECSCKDRNVVCGRLSNKCNRGENRCCGTSKASCSSDCDCCKGFYCKSSGICALA